jgi:hypothetical protein
MNLTQKRNQGRLRGVKPLFLKPPPPFSREGDTGGGINMKDKTFVKE